LTSCGEDIYSNDPGAPQQETAETQIQNFNTRLTNQLLISGTRCLGGETVDAEGQTHTCDSGNYLVTVDNVNTCTPEGCTDVIVEPIIAGLLGPGSSDSSNFFEIVPISPVSNPVEGILENVLLRTRPLEAPRVIFR
jgi:hypothetical protein